MGPVGSGKTTAATHEILLFIPHFLKKKYGISETWWVVVRNTYSELRDTTQRTIFKWFPFGEHKKKSEEYILRYPPPYDFTVGLMFRSCDRPEDLKKFKSLDITGYWIDESIEVNEKVKRMLKTRIGRFPRKNLVRFGIETTNPPDVEHPTYSQFKWDTPPPGPIPSGMPLKNHIGFWQPPRENEANLRDGYYDDLISDYKDNPDWVSMYVEGKPGIIIRGKLVYNNFLRDNHVAKQSLIWTGNELYRGWDNSGNCPACIVIQKVDYQKYQILREFHTDKMGIVDFSVFVKEQCDKEFPNAIYTDWADPAGANRYSTREGGFTSNAQLMEDEGIKVLSSDQNLTARIQSVDIILGVPDGLLIDPSCSRLINGFLGGYCYSEVKGTGEYSRKPEKNKYSHIHDALQYVMVKLIGSKGFFNGYDLT